LLHALIAIFGSVTGAALEESVIGFDIGSEINNFAGSELFCGLQNNCFAMMIGGFVMTSEANIADIFAALCGIRGRDFIFGEDGREWALGYASAAINAGVRVNIDPRPFSERLAGNHTLDRAYFDATAVTNA
jgi:hypothetical protein